MSEPLSRLEFYLLCLGISSIYFLISWRRNEKKIRAINQRWAPVAERLGLTFYPYQSYENPTRIEGEIDAIPLRITQSTRREGKAPSILDRIWRLSTQLNPRDYSPHQTTITIPIIRFSLTLDSRAKDFFELIDHQIGPPLKAHRIKLQIPSLDQRFTFWAPCSEEATRRILTRRIATPLTHAHPLFYQISVERGVLMAQTELIFSHIDSDTAELTERIKLLHRLADQLNQAIADLLPLEDLQFHSPHQPGHQPAQKSPEPSSPILF